MFRLKRTIPIIIAYKAVLELLYVLDTSKVFGYYGLTVSMNFEKMVVSYILLIAILSLSPTNEKRPSTYFYFFLIIFTIVPLLCYYWLNDQNSLYILMVFVAMLTIRLVLWLPRLRVPKLVIKHELPILLLFGVIYLGLYIGVAEQ